MDPARPHPSSSLHVRITRIMTLGDTVAYRDLRGSRNKESQHWTQRGGQALPQWSRSAAGSPSCPIASAALHFPCLRCPLRAERRRQCAKQPASLPRPSSWWLRAGPSRHHSSSLARSALGGEQRVGSTLPSAVHLGLLRRTSSSKAWDEATGHHQA